MQDEWQDPAFAAEWDQEAWTGIGNTTRAEQVDIMISYIWNRLERVSEAKSGLNGDEFLERLKRKEDHPASLEEHLNWLRQAGFEATCLHLHLHRAVIAGIKWD